ncbi:MAG: DUF4440 domain-containing protein [Alphaproteobacteria bacterium]|nr:DUF4440 domain-containing protein [Alphaproteobacteria bacterium]
MTTTPDIITAYLAAFNRGDWAGMLALLADDVVHDINQGGAEHGKPAFAAFLERMARCYREELRYIVIMASPDGTHAAAEFQVHGAYLAEDTGLPPARGQRYALPAGAFFCLKDGRISRVTMYYNLQEWLRQVGG